MHLAITAFYASLLAICYFYLSVLVIKDRRSEKVGLGDGGHPSLRRLIRAHANFNEYVPICLVMLACLEINTHQYGLAHLFGLTLLVGRVLHAYGLKLHEGASWQRLAGMLMTFIALLGLAVANLFMVYWSFEA